MGNWISLATAIDDLARRHDLTRRYADYDVCVRIAEDAMMSRLAEGLLPTIASLVQIAPSADETDFLDEIREGSVPVQFWNRWIRCPESKREAEWVTGDFKYDNAKGVSDWRVNWGKAFDVRIDAAALLWIADGENGALDVEPGQVTKTRGRPPANWWPYFAEELAVYVHENGIPTGKGTEGQSELIDAIFRRMAESGKVEPTRSTVQLVINAVLKRLRSAGNS